MDECKPLPLSLPLSWGSTRATALAAPVEVGTMLSAAARARRRSRCDASRMRWSPARRIATAKHKPFGQNGFTMLRTVYEQNHSQVRSAVPCSASERFQATS